MIETEYLIVGQGIAGTLVSHELIKRDKKVLHIDRGHKNSSSSVAAGVVNPITGRRFVLKSDFLQLREKALQVYAELEELVQIQLVQHLPMIRILKNEDEVKRWEERKEDPDFSTHLGDFPNDSFLSKVLKIKGNSVTIKSAFKLNISDLVASYRNLLEVNKLIIEEEFDFSALSINLENCNYKGIQAPKIVFCEGAKIVQNPYFNFIPMQPSKGQALIVELPVKKLPYMINAGLIIVPEGDNRYWVGTANKWKYEHEMSEDELKKRLESKLRSLIGCDFKVISSAAAVRPGIKDRMPVMGAHPENDNLLVFNGLGTKGSSLGPLWAVHFVDFLSGDLEKLNPKVNLERFV